MHMPLLINISQRTVVSKMRKKERLVRHISHILLALSSVLALDVACCRSQRPFIHNYQAEYRLYWHGLEVGTSQHTVEYLTQNRIIATAHSTPYLSFLPFESFERSALQVKTTGVEPLVYTFRTRENRKRLAGVLRFHWKTLKVQKQIEGKAQGSEPIPKAAQDKISQIFQLRCDLRLGKRNLTYTVVEPQEIKIYRYTRLGTERLVTPIGPLETIKVEHISDNSEHRTQLWLAKELDYLLVKLIQIHKGKQTAHAIIDQLNIKSR